MTRRSLIEWLARIAGGVCAGIVVVPGMRYVLDPWRRSSDAEQRGFKRVARLEALTIGAPRQFSVRDVHRDAWTLYPEETVGRVWLVRRTESAGSPEQSCVDAFSIVCPHLGCAIQMDSEVKRFVCPCHKGAFLKTGEKVEAQELGHKNPSPRGMDKLECRVAQDEATQEWWVEVRYQKFRLGLTSQTAVA